MSDESNKLVQPIKNGPPKRLLDQLTEEALASDWVGRKPTKKNKALFLSKKDEIKEALDAGWHMKNIWVLLAKQKAFVGGYDSFIRYVHRYVKNADDAPQAPTLADEPSAHPMRTPKRDSLGVPSNFDFSPTFNPQELYGDEEKEDGNSAKNGAVAQKSQ